MGTLTLQDGPLFKFEELAGDASGPPVLGHMAEALLDKPWGAVCEVLFSHFERWEDRLSYTDLGRLERFAHHCRTFSYPLDPFRDDAWSRFLVTLEIRPHTVAAWVKRRGAHCKLKMYLGATCPPNTPAILHLGRTKSRGTEKYEHRLASYLAALRASGLSVIIEGETITLENELPA